jgi:transcription-repair coupling factor (superfamily II helicase)
MRGFIQLDIQGSKEGLSLAIQYKGKDRLYLPVDQMNLMVQKYVGSEARPKVNKLSSQVVDGQRLRLRRKGLLRKWLMDLVELYAKREKLKGSCFWSPDTPWQQTV